MTARERRRFLVSIAIALAIGILTSLAFLFRWLPGVDQLQDLYNDQVHFKTRAGERARTVVMVVIDDKSVVALAEQYGRFFSWPRSLHAQVIDNLAAAKARVIVFDVLFDAPSPDDAVLGRSIADAKNVILAAVGEPPVPGKLEPGQPPTYKVFIKPRKELAAGALALAHAHTSPDPDAIVRRTPLLAKAGDEELPALSLAGQQKYLRREKIVEAKAPGFLYAGGRPIPVDPFGQMIINYVGPASHQPEVRPGPVPVVSYVDVLQGTFDRSLVEDKLVFVGLTATGFADDFPTPTSLAGVKMWGVEIHAQTAETLQRAGFLRPQGAASAILFILGLSLLPGYVLARFPPFRAAAVSLGLFALYHAAGITYVVLAGEAARARAQTFSLLNVVYPSLALVGTFLFVMMYRIVFEQREQRLTKGLMGKYLSPAVMDEVLQDPDQLGLGGVKREMSVLFADIRGFTTISEKMEPRELTAFLNEFLTEMTDIVYKHQGVLDKYIGDMVMAFWGAPLEQPNHAELACRTAVEMIERLGELRPGWESRGLPPIYIGIGLSTGPMTVGNVGGSKRFDYTVIGDAVNLGARLQDVNKEYGTWIIVPEVTQANVQDLLVVRYLDLITVKGKLEPVKIYELVALKESQKATEWQEVLAVWEQAMSLYRDERRFVEAKASFEKTLELRPTDGPAKVYNARCEEYVEAPPPADWDGVYVMTHK